MGCVCIGLKSLFDVSKDELGQQLEAAELAGVWGVEQTWGVFSLPPPFNCCRLLLSIQERFALCWNGSEADSASDFQKLRTFMAVGKQGGGS